MLESETTSANGENVVALRGELSLAETKAIRDALLAGMDGARTVRVDLREVTTLELPGLQLLYAARAEALKRGVGLLFDAGDNQARLERMCEFAGLAAISDVAPSDQE